MCPAPKRYLFRIIDRIANRANRFLPLQKPPGGNFNILEVAALKAALDSAEYYQHKMLTARAIDGALDLLTRAASLAARAGQTIRHLAGLHSERLYGFDSFEGLPETWRSGYDKGAFSGELPTVPDNVELIKGWFSDSLPPFLSMHAGRISFLHVDCDLYSSTKTILDLLEPRLGAGSVIVFDEYWNYPGWQQHEYKAFYEFIEKTGKRYRYDSFVPFTQQVCVVII